MFGYVIWLDSYLSLTEMNVQVVHVVCPKDDPVEMTASFDEARALFENYCPAGARVTDVAGIRETDKLKCAWIVKYGRRQGFDHIGPEQLAWQIRIRKPNNTSIAKEIKQFPPGLIITYSIDCFSPSAGRFRNSKTLLFIKEFDSDGDSMVMLENLKLEENEL